MVSHPDSLEINSIDIGQCKKFRPNWKVYFPHTRNKFLHDAVQCFYNNNSVTLLYYRIQFVYIAVHTNVYRDVIT